MKPPLPQNLVFLPASEFSSLWPAFLWLTGEVQTESRLHEKAARHHKQHAGHPCGLARRGRRGVQAPERDPLPGCELH